METTRTRDWIVFYEDSELRLVSVEVRAVGFAQAVTFAGDKLRRDKVNTAGWHVLSVERSDTNMLRNRKTTA